MTKFTDRLENELEQIADHATPSPTAWQAIQQRMAEPKPNEARDIIMLTAEPDAEQETAEPNRKWLLVAAAAALVAIAAGVFAINRDGSDNLLVTDDPPEEGVDQDSTDGDQDEDSSPDAAEEATPLVPGLPVNGLTETDLLGMTMTFDVPSTMETEYVEPGAFQLVKPGAEEKDVGVFVTGRVGGWYDAEQSVDVTYRGEGSIAANDIEGWIEANQHIAVQLPDTTISGRTARVFDIRVDETIEGSLYEECPRCVLVFSSSSEFFDPLTAQISQKVITAFTRIRMWFIEVDGFDPIVIFAAGLNDQSTYPDDFEATILPTIEFGPDAGPDSSSTSGATPILPGLPLSAGLVQTDLLGETVTMELPEDMSVAFARAGEIQLNGTTEVPKILVMARVGGWYSGAEAIDSTYVGEGSISARDPQAWVDDNGVIGERRPGFLEVSGRIATIWDITVDPAFEGSLSDDCPQCMLVYSVSSEFFDPNVAQSEARTINADVTMRMYFFEGLDGVDPFVFFAAGLGGDTSFIDEFEQTIFPTIGFERDDN